MTIFLEMSYKSTNISVYYVVKFNDSLKCRFFKNSREKKILHSLAISRKYIILSFRSDIEFK